MKKITLIFVFCLSVLSYADDYKILQMNTATIKIGNQLCKKGDVFSDESEIVWDNDKQAIKAQNLKTKEIRLFIGQEFKLKDSKSIKDYYIRTEHLSTRGEILTLSDLEESIPDTLFLCDTIKIESPFIMNSDYYYYLKCVVNGNISEKPIKFEKRNMIVDKEVLGESIQDELPASLYFKMNKEKYLVKDSLTIIVIPWD